MDPDRRARVEALFAAAIGHPAPHRAVWLARACEGDRSLYVEVQSLLEAHARPGGILDRGAGRLPEGLVERARPPRPVGPYRILAEVGRGGMSVVYMAERSDGQFRRRVALKVLRGELDAEELHARLSAERQILAALDHPNIARLLDGGMTEEGRPYLVMEYVDGRPLDRYCDEGDLTVRERLLLFLEVARAVQHAHARLVVHRDLKPSNIVVTAEGRVRLLDFGIAKVLDFQRVDLDRERAPVTRIGARLFTPEYASPEQLTQQPASTSNDIWALGVLLYELLCGTRPFRTEARAERELEREILETDPLRPSARVLHGPAETARRRGATPRALARQLAGDLDRIVAMALRKEPARRYGSVEQLAEDVERFLENRPVRAQPDRIGYRLAKFLRRHRVEAAAAALALLFLFVGSGAALWEARVAELALEQAEAAALRSEAVADYLLDLYRTADPWAVPVDRLTAREILARGEARLEELPADPLLRARLLLALGQVYTSLGDHAAARPLLEEAAEIRSRELSPGDPGIGEALRAVAEVLRREGRLAEAEARALAALAASRSGAGSRGAERDPEGEAAALDLLGFVYTGMGRLPAAEAHFGSELRVLHENGLGEAPAVGSALVNLAAVHRRQARFAEAEALLREALAHRRRTLGPDHPLTAVTLARLGGLLHAQLGRHAEGERAFREALEIQAAALGPDHPARGEALLGLASLYADLGDGAGAEAHYREAVRVLTAGLGSDHPNTIETLESLAGHLGRNGQALEADSIFRATLAVRRRTLGPEHSTVAGALVGRARVLLELGRPHDAETELTEGLRIRTQVFGGDHALVAYVLEDLALVYAAMGEPERAESALREAAGILAALYPEDHPDRARVRSRIAQAGGISGG